jgi:hypothetical protein
LKEVPDNLHGFGKRPHYEPGEFDRMLAHVIPLGLPAEPTKSTDDQDARDLAFKLLQQGQLWWEPGYVRTVLHGAPRPLDPVYFPLSVDEISGHKAKLN